MIAPAVFCLRSACSSAESYPVICDESAVAPESDCALESDAAYDKAACCDADAEANYYAVSAEGFPTILV